MKTEDKNPEQTKDKTIKPKPTIKPTLQIDMEGNLNKTQVPNEQNQPIDCAKVKNPMKILPPRPTLSESTHLEAAKQLDKHNKETNRQIEDEKIKLKKQQNITGTEREKKIIELFNKQACKVGIAPITKKHVLAVCGINDQERNPKEK